MAVVSFSCEVSVLIPVGQVGNLRPIVNLIVNRPVSEFGIIYGPISNRPLDAILHTSGRIDIDGVAAGRLDDGYAFIRDVTAKVRRL